ncbi:MAG: dienelactone hydrolase family protein [Alphaproteobacteria bacterium]
MTDITVNSADGGAFSAYRADPAAGTGPGLLVIQEIFGVNKVMRDICNGLAEQGYVALCPDLFWRQEPNVRLTDQTDQEWQRAFELMQGFDEAKGIDDLKASLAALRTTDGCTGRAGTIGFCLGGRLAYLMAARSDADCNVGYYPVGIENNLGEAIGITRPLLLHIAEEDGFVPKDAQARINSSLGSNPNVRIHNYPGVDHAFARPGGKNHDAAAAENANGRTAAFLAANLRD